MKKLIIVMLSALIVLVISVSQAHAKSSHRVRSYTKKSGAYVTPHRKKTQINRNSTTTVQKEIIIHIQARRAQKIHLRNRQLKKSLKQDVA